MRNLHSVFRSGLHQFTFPPKGHKSSLFTTLLPALIICCLLIITILTGVMWYLIVVLICISLMMSDIQHLFLHLLVICISPLDKCLFRSSAHFWIGLFDFFCFFFFDNELYEQFFILLEIKPLIVTSFSNIFFHSLDCLLFLVFVLFFGFLGCGKDLKFKFHLLIFILISIIFGDGFKKILLQIMPTHFLPMFSSKRFIVFGITFRSLIYFEFIFICSVENVLISFFSMQLFSFPSITFWRDCLVSIVYSCLFYHRLIDCRCLGLFLGFLSCSVDLYIFFCVPIPCSLITVTL